LREEFRVKTCWHVPSLSLLNEMRRHEPLVSVGSGHAYTEALAKERGIDILATDIDPTKQNRWCHGNVFYTNVEKLTARQAVIKYSNRNVFMAWPPYDNKMAIQVVKAMKRGRYLIYIGESMHGCTGCDEFFLYLNTNFQKLNTKAKIDNWSGVHDCVYLYKKVSGLKNKKLKYLQEKTIYCKNGHNLSSDLNAAKNILKEGLKNIK
jgi:hypothetical protein